MAPQIDILSYVINHVFLPVKLPSTGDDEAAGKNDLLMLDWLSKSLQKYASLLEEGDRKCVLAASSMIEGLSATLDASGYIMEDQLKIKFNDLLSSGE
jgi:hypothetical protein